MERYLRAWPVQQHRWEEQVSFLRPSCAGPPCRRTQRYRYSGDSQQWLLSLSRVLRRVTRTRHATRPLRRSPRASLRHPRARPDPALAPRRPLSPRISFRPRTRTRQRWQDARRESRRLTHTQHIPASGVRPILLIPVSMSSHGPFPRSRPRQHQSQTQCQAARLELHSH